MFECCFIDRLFARLMSRIAALSNRKVGFQMGVFLLCGLRFGSWCCTLFALVMVKVRLGLVWRRQAGRKTELGEALHFVLGSMRLLVACGLLVLGFSLASG